MQSHLSHLLQPNLRDQTVPKMLNLGRLFGSTHLGSEGEHLAAPQLLNPTSVHTSITAEISMSCTAGLLLRHTHILVPITSVSVYVGKLSTLESTTLPVHRVSRNV